MSSITLSAATRQNLLSLQDTAGLLSTTQNRLSTGKKVNSALDNPTNFFTSQSLSSRSTDLSSLLDGMSNGVQVIQAANQGISSIQKLLDTAKSTAQQALADKSGGTSATISGGHAALAASVTGGAVYGASSGGTQDFSSLAKDGSLDISLDGGVTKTTLRLDASTLKSTTNDLAHVSKDQIISAINGQIAANSSLKGKVTATSTPDGKITLNTVGTGGNQQIKVAGAAGSSIDLGFGIDTSTPTAASVVGAGPTFPLTTLTATKGAALQVSDGSTTTTVKIDGTSLKSDGTALGASASAANIADAINLQLKAGGSTLTADATTGQLRFTSQDKGPSSSVTVTGVAYDATTAANNIDIGFGNGDGTGGTTAYNAGTLTAGTGAAATGLTAAGADATDGSSKATLTGGSTINATTVFTAKDASFTLKLGDGPSKIISINAATFGSGAASVTQSSIAKAINDQIGLDTGLSGKVQASYVNNKLVIQTTAAGSDQKLSLTTNAAAAGSTAVDIGFGTAAAVTSTGAGTDVGGSKGTSSVRSALADQFNTILQQITQQAQDSSYNGVNLLYRSSNNTNDNTLHISFNEKNSSALDIKGVRFDATGLGLTNVTGNFQSDDDINAAITQLSTATSTLRTQSSTFGSNLSVVQNRQDFTKQLTTILDTGASNLTSADLNEEAANSQALSTRNSLAISALSLANQAQQGILQLLR